MNKPETPPHDDIAGPSPRHVTTQVMVGNVAVGGGAPIVVQSMTNTDTADIQGTIAQVAALSRAGSEMVRITVDRDEAAAAVPHIRDGLRKRGITTPLIGDFHYIGHKLLAEYPACAEALDKYRINPGNVGFKDKRDKQFSAIVETAIKYNKPGGAVAVEVKPVGKYSIRISVRDTGTGLAPSQLTQLFQPFNRLGQEAGAEQGTGIGLVMTKRLVEMMGGTIGVDSAVGVGSEF